MEAQKTEDGYTFAVESQSSLYWSRVGRTALFLSAIFNRVSQSSLYWSRVGRTSKKRALPKKKPVAILIVLEQGWKKEEDLYNLLYNHVAILIVLEQGWKDHVKL